MLTCKSILELKVRNKSQLVTKTLTKYGTEIETEIETSASVGTKMSLTAVY